jgi:hypothetical protein
MSIEFLRQVAATPLPKSFTHAKDIDAVKILRQAGLVIALVDELPEGAAKVMAITERGKDELLRFHYPSQGVSQGEVRAQGSSWFELAAQQVRSLIRGTDASG